MGPACVGGERRWSHVLLARRLMNARYPIPGAELESDAPALGSTAVTLNGPGLNGMYDGVRIADDGENIEVDFEPDAGEVTGGEVAEHGENLAKHLPESMLNQIAQDV